MSTPTSLAQDLQFAVELARGAGKIVLEHFGKVERLTKTHAATTDDAVVLARVELGFELVTPEAAAGVED